VIAVLIPLNGESCQLSKTPQRVSELGIQALGVRHLSPRMPRFSRKQDSYRQNRDLTWATSAGVEAIDLITATSHSLV